MLWRSTQTFLKSGKVAFVPVSAIRPNPSQPRRIFDPDGLRELTDSVARYGIIQPLCVRRSGGSFELVAGERRLRAAKAAGLGEVPCILLEVDEAQSSLLALVENIQRRDLDYIEQAQGIALLMEQCALSQEQAAARLGCSQSAVANKLRLLRHPPEVLDALREHHLTERHARALLRVADPERRLALVDRIAAGGWSVAKTEQYIDAMAAAAPPRREIRTTRPVRDVRLFLNAVEHSLTAARSAGIDARCGREDTTDEIVLTIRVPKRAGQTDHLTEAACAAV